MHQHVSPVPDRRPRLRPGYVAGMVLEPEPVMVTDPTLTDVLDELRAREPLFHRPELGTTRSDLEAMTTEDFWEVGASGRVYSRAHVLDVLVERYQHTDEDEWETSDFYCRRIGPEVYLLTYTLRQAKRVTRRSTLWKHTPGQWKVLYHQGTIVDDTQPRSQG
jgi:hypothetical protein